MDVQLRGLAFGEGHEAAIVEEQAQVGIAALGDSAEATAQSGGVLRLGTKRHAVR
jgi:hypothetical protein